MRRGWTILRVLRGFPITIGLASAFAIIFVSVPIMRIAALVRRQKSADIPLIMSAVAYHEVAAKICEVLNRQGLPLQAAEAGWRVSAPMRLLTWLGGEALRSHVPNRFAHFVAHDLTLTLYPSGLVMRGNPARLTWAHGLVAEAVVHTEGLQTTDPKAQALSGVSARCGGATTSIPRDERTGKTWPASSSTSFGSSAPWRSAGTTGRSSTGKFCSWEEPRTANDSCWTPSHHRRWR